jgi:signal transduction histidine kinase
VRWGPHLARARVVLGLAALASELTQRFGTVPLLIQVALALFIGYSLAVLRWDRLQGGAFGLLTLFADTVFLLILSNQGAGISVWFPTLFYLLLMAEGVVFYSVREVAIVGIVCTAFCVLARQPRLDTLLRPVVMGGVLGIAFALYKRYAESQRAELLRQIQAAQELAGQASDWARQRVAQDFHDGPLQSYISLQMRLDILRKLLERDQAGGMQELHQLQDLAQSQVRELRSFIRGLRGPVETDSAGLMVSARHVAEVFQKESGIPVTFVVAESVPEVAPEVSTEVVQMLREALHNVQKHAGATRVAIGLERAGNALEISVDDNGHGFRFSGTYNLDELELLRLGPASIKRRARGLNADLTLESRPGRGAGLKLRIPTT